LGRSKEGREGGREGGRERKRRGNEGKEVRERSDLSPQKEGRKDDGEKKIRRAGRRETEKVLAPFLVSLSFPFPAFFASSPSEKNMVEHKEEGMHPS
jgi:hypothetical protein